MLKTALVTGGSRGIGKSLVKKLSSLGYAVAFLYLNSENEARQLEKEYNAVAIRTDVRDFLQVKDAVKLVISKFSKIDLLINNAAVSNSQKVFCDIGNDEWQNLMDVNINGEFNVTKCVLPYMINRKSGHIINISSVWGITGASCEVDYSTSKAAIIGFTKALAKEVAQSNILVNCVAPGVVQTDMNSHLSDDDMCALKEEIPLNRTASADEIADSIIFVSNQSYLTGQVISPNGGLVI